MYSKITKTLNYVVAPVIFFVFFIGVWELIVSFFSIPEYIMPGPLKIFSFMLEKYDILVFHATITSFEAMLGLAIAIVFGLLVSILFYYSPLAKYVLYPYIVGLKTTPVIAIVPLLLLWFGHGIFSKAITATLICFFPIIVNTVEGFSMQDKDMENLLKSYNTNKWQKLWKVRVPMSILFIFSGLRTSSTLAVIGAIVAEFVGASRGIGFFILTNSYYVDTVAVFSGVIVAMFIGLIFWGLFLLIGHLVKKKYHLVSK